MNRFQVDSQRFSDVNDGQMTLHNILKMTLLIKSPGFLSKPLYHKKHNEVIISGQDSKEYFTFFSLM